MKEIPIMKKYIQFFLIISSMFFVFVISGYCQEDMRIIDNSHFENPQRSAALFPHDIHNETAGIDECNTCHHLYDNDGVFLPDESSEDQKCSECHIPDGKNGKIPLMKAFHTNCKKCHAKEKKGPVMCGECHLNR